MIYNNTLPELSSALQTLTMPVKKTTQKDDLLFFSDWYSKIEQKLKINNIQDVDITNLCNSNENLDQPVYSWYNLKEAFSKDLPLLILEHLKKQYNYAPKTVVDPYCGGATSIISLKRAGLHAVGIEYNPFIAWVANTKLKWSIYDTREIVRTINALDFKQQTNATIPPLSTLHEGKYFRKATLLNFQSVLLQIRNSKCSSETKDFLIIGLSSIIEDLGNLKKDGRALRYKKKIKRPPFEKMIRDRWQQYLNDLANVKQWQFSSPGEILKGSAKNLRLLTDFDGNSHSLHDNTTDLVLYSPPYLNNFDYSEIYKLELWLLGFIETSEQWQQLRKGTIRSHHSIKFTKTNHLENDDYSKDLFELISRMSVTPLLKHRKKNMSEVIVGFFDDMFISLTEQYRILKPGGYLVYNVANSKHGKLSILTDLIIAEIAIRVGFSPKELIPVCDRNGRTSKKSALRESIVIMQKPLNATENQ